MKRLSVIVARGTMIVALGAMTIGLAACGGHKDDSADQSGPHSTVSGTVVTSSVAATAISAAPTSTAPVSNAPGSSALGPASRTPCSTFKNMDTDAEKALVEKVLAENPGSRYAGSPDVALGTAKLVCLAHSEQNQPVAVAVGIVQQ
jgi:hypothetical protein